MNRTAQQALQILNTCLMLPNWMALVIHRSCSALRPRPRWAARIRPAQTPAPEVRPRLPGLPRRHSA